MPTFDIYGEETVICQVCATIVKGSEVEWMTPVPGKSFNGNVCKKCQK